MKRYYIIVGEASGDLHAANLIKELLLLDKNAQFQGFGGEKMHKEGLVLTKHYKDMAFMGFWEVLMNLFVIRNHFKQAKKEILEFNADVLILVDYPGFNMRMAKFAKKHKIKVVYYITPQIWAWKESRVNKLRRDVDLLLPVLPFECSFFAKHSVDFNYVGHPLLDALKDLDSKNIESEKPIIAILPGSRKQEIANSLPIMMEVAKSFENYQFIIAGAPSISIDYYRSITKDSYMPILTNKTHALLKDCKAAMITSGTATLEAAILKVPQVVCYKTSFISYIIGKLLVKVKYIALVNLICDKEVVKELIQDDFNIENLVDELNYILNNKNRIQILSNYNKIIDLLGKEGASKRAAKAIISLN